MKAVSSFFAVVLALRCAEVAQPSEPSPLDPAGQRNHSRPGPWDNDVLVYQVSVNGEAEKLATFASAGVPTLARLKDGCILAAFQHFPEDDDRNFDQVAVRFSGDEGRTWTTPEPVVVAGMESGLARPFDPTLVPLPDGRARPYFTSNRSPDFRRSTPAIYSAVSSNGVLYRFEPGVRFGLEGRIVIDCAAARHGEVFHLIVPDNGPAGKAFDRSNITSGLEPARFPLQLYMQAAICELADRTRANQWTTNLDGVIYPDAPWQAFSGAPGRNKRRPL